MKWHKVETWVLSMMDGINGSVTVENWGVERGSRWIEVKLVSGRIIEFWLRDEGWSFAADHRHRETAEKLLPHVVELANALKWADPT